MEYDPHGCAGGGHGRPVSRSAHAREEEAKKRPCAVVAMQSHAMDHHRQEGVPGGADGHIAKPITPGPLMAGISTAIMVKAHSCPFRWPAPDESPHSDRASTDDQSAEIWRKAIADMRSRPSKTSSQRGGVDIGTGPIVVGFPLMIVPCNLIISIIPLIGPRLQRLATSHWTVRTGP